MKKFFIVVLVLHLLLECGVGLALAFKPTVFVPDLDPLTLPFFTNLGAVVIVVGLIVFWIWPYRDNAAALSVGLGVLAMYHSLVAVLGVSTLLQSGDGTALSIHAVLGLCFWVLWQRREAIAAA